MAFAMKDAMLLLQKRVVRQEGFESNYARYVVLSRARALHSVQIRIRNGFVETFLMITLVRL